MSKVFHGVFPEDNTNKVKVLRPGKYLATVVNADPAQSFKGGAQIAVTFEAKQQGQIREYIEASIDLESKVLFKIQRLLAALDMPSEEYWSAEKREPHTWDVLQEIKDAIEMGREVIVEVGTYEKRDGTSTSTVKSLTSPRRYPELAQQVNVGPNGEVFEPSRFVGQDEVPF